MESERSNLTGSKFHKSPWHTRCTCALSLWARRCAFSAFLKEEKPAIVDNPSAFDDTLPKNSLQEYNSQTKRHWQENLENVLSFSSLIACESPWLPGGHVFLDTGSTRSPQLEQMRSMWASVNIICELIWARKKRMMTTDTLHEIDFDRANKVNSWFWHHWYEKLDDDWLKRLPAAFSARKDVCTGIFFAKISQSHLTFCCRVREADISSSCPRQRSSWRCSLLWHITTAPSSKVILTGLRWLKASKMPTSWVVPIDRAPLFSSFALSMEAARGRTRRLSSRLPSSTAVSCWSKKVHPTKLASFTCYFCNYLAFPFQRRPATRSTTRLSRLAKAGPMDGHVEKSLRVSEHRCVFTFDWQSPKLC